MDSAALLDLLGNENRRRILRLLARKPCYVTEISEYLGVSPKAVIDHLRKLEKAGLVESRVDDQRRKYFSIARNLRLEVNVSPYGFGAKSAYSASRGLDMTRCRYLTIDITTPEQVGELTELTRELQRLEKLSSELSMAQRWVHGRLTEVMDGISRQIHEDSALGTSDGDDARFYAEVLSALANGSERVDQIGRSVDASPDLVENALHSLARHGVVEQNDGEWTLTAD
ncbi:ArsR/SmtB family transcription factor [Halocatena pleomorpha]|uniref:ArsR family transcriptional regulator n=1 Tax=Halocatena pleomorpha TaxID=1785090 RepID=A0A3P3RK66_9EURY|nr:metalloregulator ArsR/SmtB family transcription factor [Halocatena pleomorpha]RRJ33724.1 ArsR family transcriptional regulator [Halocatena pleomorpha]